MRRSYPAENKLISQYLGVVADWPLWDQWSADQSDTFVVLILTTALKYSCAGYGLDITKPDGWGNCCSEVIRLRKLYHWIAVAILPRFVRSKLGSWSRLSRSIFRQRIYNPGMHWAFPLPSWHDLWKPPRSLNASRYRRYLWLWKYLGIYNCPEHWNTRSQPRLGCFYRLEAPYS